MYEIVRDLQDYGTTEHLVESVKLSNMGKKGITSRKFWQTCRMNNRKIDVART